LPTPGSPLRAVLGRRVAARLARRVPQRRVVAQDPVPQRDQLRGRVHPELLGELAAGALERPQRLGFAAGLVEGEQQPGEQALVPRVGGEQVVELADGQLVVAQLDVQVDAHDECLAAAQVEPVGGRA
jgi:hypothetical protein